MKHLLLLALVLASPARADVTLGAKLSLTGPGAGLGVPARNTIELLPKTMAGGSVRWVVLDDGSDSTFHTALRDAMERVRGLAGAEAVSSLSPTDQSGAEPASHVLIEIRGDDCRLVPS